MVTMALTRVVRVEKYMKKIVNDHTPTHQHTHLTNTHTHRQDRLQYTVPQLASVQCSSKSNKE